MSTKFSPALVLIASLISSAALAATRPPNTKVCVQVVLVEEVEEPEQPAPEPVAVIKGEVPAAEASKNPFGISQALVQPQPVKATVKNQASQSATFLPLGQTPIVYMKRLFEHFITHEKGYEAVQEDCKYTLKVELYPLTTGWTAFARYNANGREERVDRLYPTELSQFAERAVLALLSDVPISNSINRENVLRADSEKSNQRIKGSNHFVVGVGTQLRGGNVSTVVNDSNSLDHHTAVDSIQVYTPMSLSMGYRGKFENWGIEAQAQLGIGIDKAAATSNPTGGHIDFGGTAQLQLHFHHYFDPRGLNSFYLGSGATFELMWFSVIKPHAASGDERSSLLGGGLDVDLVLGWEFMRASAVQFYLQAELHIPAFVLQSANNYGELNTWFPGLGVKLGMMF